MFIDQKMFYCSVKNTILKFYCLYIDIAVQIIKKITSDKLETLEMMSVLRWM